MGKRIKWFTEAECDLIRAGNFQYILTFSLEHEENQQSQAMSVIQL